MSKDYAIEGRGSALPTSEEVSLLEARMRAVQLKEQQLKDLGIDTGAIRAKFEKSNKQQPSMTLENAAILQTQ